MKINATVNPPAVVWSNFYDASYMEPRDIIESPYNPNEVIVVGRCDLPFFAPNADAFYLNLNAVTGAVNTFTTYTSIL
jgi:hypothetical protein